MISSHKEEKVNRRLVDCDETTILLFLKEKKTNLLLALQVAICAFETLHHSTTEISKQEEELERKS